MIDPVTALYPPEMTPLVLAAQRNNYEILKHLLDHGATLPMPHDVRCGCEDCLCSAFQLSWELRQLAISEPESNLEYIKLQRQVEKFAVDLLQQSRTTGELNTILNHDPETDGAQPEKPLAPLEVAI